MRGTFYWISLPGKGPLLGIDGEVMVVHTGPALSDPDAPKDAKDLKERKVSIDLWRVTKSVGGRKRIFAGTGGKWYDYHLSAAPPGKGGRISLARLPKAGANWQLPLKDTPSEFETGIDSKDYEGYGLDVEGEGTRFVMEGYVCTGYRLKLTKGPGRDWVFHPTSP